MRVMIRDIPVSRTLVIVNSWFLVTGGGILLEGQGRMECSGVGQ